MTLSPREVVEAPAREWRRYPEYKDSGVGWLGEVPDHWEVKRIRYICSLNPSKSENRGLPADGAVSFVPMEKIGEGGGLSLDETRMLQEVHEGYTYFRNGDVVVAKITPCFENGKGALCEDLVGGVGFGTTELQVLRVLGENHSKFVFYLTISDAFRRLGTSMMKGSAGQKRVPDEFTLNFKLGMPTSHEQRAIATFLDRETQKIDDLIAKRERLIRLLEEKRTALISQAVTKGLDPDIPTQNLGLKWIGDTPTHWELLPLRRVIRKFVDYRGATPEKTPLGIPLVTARNIKDGSIDLTQSPEFISQNDYVDWMVRGFPEVGDVLITTEAPLGESAQVNDQKIALAQRIILLKADKHIIYNDYLKYYYLSQVGKAELKSRSTGSTALGIKASHLREVLIPTPPVPEQLAIVSLLDRETKRIGAFIRKAKEHIEKLREYRTALISAAVTGKIDVREEVP